MKKIRFLFKWVIVLTVIFSSCKNQANQEAETTANDIETMVASNVPKSGIALGGVGAGSMELRKDGIFYNWQIANNLPRGTGKRFDYPESSNLFFVVRYQEQDKEPRMKVLQIANSTYNAAIGTQLYSFPWISGVKKTTYKARFPFVEMTFSDPDMPFDVVMETFTPFIPHDVKNSTLPGVYFNFTIQPKSDKPVDVMLMASYRNMAGFDTPTRTYKSSTESKDTYVNTVATVASMDTTASSFGDISMSSLSGQSTYYLGWEHLHPYYEIVLRSDKLPNTDDTEGRNSLDKKTNKKVAMERCFSTVAFSAKLSNAEIKHSFVYAWNFPNLYNVDLTLKEGNYYNNYFKNSSEVVAYMAQNKEDLTKRSKEFLNNFYTSSLPVYALDQINSQLNTFITSTFIGKKGYFGILEGMNADRSCCGVATIDVGMYGMVMIAALFPELQKSTMRFHRSQQSQNGLVLHALDKNYACADKPGCTGACCAKGEATDRLDLPSQFVSIIMRDYFWTNDTAYLKENWEGMKKAIDYVIKERDKNGDMLPDMTGIMCSYDNFPMYGDASYILSQWNCAIASAIEGAKVLGDTSVIEKYQKILDAGKKVYDEKLWNDKYFRLYNCSLESHKGVDEGCLTDQMVGQWAADLSGLGRIIDPVKTKEAMKNILAMSYKSNYGLRNCSWPGDKYWHDIDKDCWVDQGNTCWTGVELAFASFLMYEGLYKEGLSVIKTVDDRYRSEGLYWNHLECGGHYFRPMAAWGILNGALGLGINCYTYTFDPQIDQNDYTLFFATPSGTAHFIKKGSKVEVKVLTGEIKLNKIILKKALTDRSALNIAGANVTKEGDAFVITFDGIQTIKAGSSLVME